MLFIDLWILNIFVNISTPNSWKIININSLFDTVIHILAFQSRQ